MSNFKTPPFDDGLLNGTDYTVGVWVSQQDAGHVGLTYLFPDETGVPKAYDFHLSGDQRVICDMVDWSKMKKQRLAHGVELDPFLVDSLPGFIRKVASNGNLRFGIDWLGNIGTIDPATGVYTPPAERPGFTCATFLSETLNAFGVKVVQQETWPQNDDEAIEWRSKLADKLEDGKRTPADVIAAIRTTEPVIRLFPAEFAAAASTPDDNRPVAKAAAFETALKIIEDFNQAYPRKPS